MKKTFFILLVILFSSFNNNIFCQKIDAFKWLVGTWKISTAKGFVVEIWQNLNDSSLQGKSYFVKDKDTIPQESLLLTKNNNEWFYISTVNGQNNNEAVAFKIIFQKETEFICLNTAHDFPQRIAYRKLGSKQLLASIEGNHNGKYAKQNFDFNKEE